MARPSSSSSSGRETSPLLGAGAGGYGVVGVGVAGAAGDDDPSATGPPPPALPLPSPWSRLVFGWFGPLLELGRVKGSLDPSDLMGGKGGGGEGGGAGGVPHASLPPSCGTECVTAEFERRWEEEKRRVGWDEEEERGGGDDRRKEPSLARALALAYGGDFARAGLLKLVHDLCVFVGPRVLNGLILYLRDPVSPASVGLRLTTYVTAAQLLMSLCLRHYFFRCYLAGLRVRTAVVSAVYRKTLALSAGERQSRTAGEVVNLVSVDAQKLQDLTNYLHAIWYSFLQIGLAVYFLWGQLGPSCLAGVAVIALSMPATRAVATLLGRAQRTLMTARDVRVDATNEILGSMGVVKGQAWEESFADRVKTLRDSELKKLYNAKLIGSVNTFLWSAVPTLIAVCTFAAYTIAGNDLDVASALTSLALFDILRFPLFMLPTILNNIVEAGVSLARVRSFLLCKEHVPVGPPPPTTETNGDDRGEDDDGPGIWIRGNATFVYDSKKPRFDPFSYDGGDAGKKKKRRRSRVLPPKSEVTDLRREAHDVRWEASILRARLEDAEGRIRELMTTSATATGTSRTAAETGTEMDPAPQTGYGAIGDEDGEEDWKEDWEEEDGGGGGGGGGKLVPVYDADEVVVEDAVKGEDEKHDRHEQHGHDIIPHHPHPSDLLSLRNVNLAVRPGELVAVVGSVGSGKSTLLNAILGEVRPLYDDHNNYDGGGGGGKVYVRGTLAYASQTPFVMNDTVRNNVLFGTTSGGAAGAEAEVDEGRYRRALNAAALRRDLTLLPHGDRTEIGERGVTLSGGQRARVSVARAAYRDADVYLLDDPLSAVDAHVGRHLFRDCVVGTMLLGRDDVKAAGGEKGRRSRSSVVLVTNAVQYLSDPNVTRIVVLRDGAVAEMGTYKDLAGDDGSLFSSFLSVALGGGRGGVEDADTDTDSDSDDDEEEIEPAADGEEEGGNAAPSSSKSPPNKGRSRSIESMVSVASSTVDKGGGAALMTDEYHESETGTVSRSVYLMYARAAGGIPVAVFLLLSYGATEGINVLSKWWLTHWSQSGGSGGEGTSQMTYLAIYALINLTYVLASFGRLILIVVCGLRASDVVFVRMLESVLKAPMAFFDTTPVGRIVNRFSKDMYTIDEQLITTLRSYIGTLTAVLGVVVVVSAVTPYFMLCLLPIGYFYAAQQRYFTITYRELKRLDSVSRSPIYALLGETLDGVSTIRAYGAEPSLISRITSMLDLQQSAYFLTCTAQCWLAVRLELAGTVIVCLSCLCVVAEHVWHRERDEYEFNEDGGGGTTFDYEAFAGLAGLSVSFALTVTQALNWSVRMGSDLEANFVAVERIEQYANMPGEAPRRTDADGDGDEGALSWPTGGSVQFRGVRMRYRPGLPLVLRGLDLVIPPRCKVGIVGRTGAGKSSLMIALLRIVELDEGSIHIDGVDIRTLGLKNLRSHIAVIPQDPVLFSGSVRTNLDPFNEYADERLYEVLSRVGLYGTMERISSGVSLTSSMSGGGGGGKRSQGVRYLTDNVLEGGSNFSVGQRQLLVIARALLRGAKIVVMDEATASVDADTDARIQRVMKTDFRDSTCLTVAHRINTVMDSDRILVMDDGRVAEFDAPGTLLARGGLFRDLVDAWEKEHEGGD